MSRPAEAVQRVIKAYDVRGLVGEEIDEAFVRDVGAAFARLVRDGAAQVVIGHDMRESSPTLSEAFADGVLAQGLDVVRIGLASTDQLYFASGLHRQAPPNRRHRDAKAAARHGERAPNRGER